MRLDRRHHLQIEFGLYEAETQWVYRRHIGIGSVAYDVGAAFGDSALLMAARGADVWSFEPEPPVALEANLALNPDLEGRIHVYPPCFIGEGDGEGRRSLDALLLGHEVPAPTFIKVDVEGAEVEVLRGSERVLAAYHPILLVEVHGLNLESQCLSLLSDAGYDTRIIRNAWWRHILPEHRLVKHNRWVLAVPRI
jgi:hypothetical protein